MCGIFAIASQDNDHAAQSVLQALKKLEYRGYDSWGIAALITDQKIQLEKHTGQIKQNRTSIHSAKFAIGHTRWATHGGVTQYNAHPHLDMRHNLALVHNGIVENYKELKIKLRQQGYQFKSETDSEVIVHLIDYHLKNDQITQAVFQTFAQLRGSNSIVVLHKPSESIIACRDGSPLVVGLGDKENYCASDVVAFLDKTKKVIYLEDQQAVWFTDSQVKLFDLKTKKRIKPQIKNVSWEAQQAKKGNFAHYLIKEILEQKHTILQAAESNYEKIKKLVTLMRTKKNIYVTGCGTAYHVSLLSQYFFSQNHQLVYPYMAHEMSSLTNFIQPEDCLIAVSQSGETADTLLTVKAAQKKKAFILGIYNAQGSSLERLVDEKLPIGVGPEIAVVSTKASTAQMTVLFLLSWALAGNLKQGMNIITSYVKELNRWLNQALLQKIRHVSQHLVDENHIFVIGKNVNYPASLEFALKIKESSYIHAEGFAASELKHGVISLIRNNTPCFCLASLNKYKRELLSSAIEVKSRGGMIFGVAPFETNEFDFLIKTPEEPYLSCISNIIVGQIMGYYLALGRGADPDKPRNLAKSVTVK